VRTLGLIALVGIALACAGPPSAREAEPTPLEDDDVSSQHEASAVRPTQVEPGELAPDPLLAKVRGQLRGGRAPAALRRQLLESRDPDHRHAGRLLQAIADEAPEPVLTRALGPAPVNLVSERSPPPDPRPAPEPEVSERPSPPQPRPTPKPDVVRDEPPAAPGPGFDDETWDPPPKLSSLPAGGPVRAWFDAGVIEPAPAPEPALAPAEPEISVERLLGPELLLLRERPPAPPAPVAKPGAGPRLVILTSVSLRIEPSGDAIVVELAGAGPASLMFVPCSSTRARVLIMNAGAVPNFLTARPTRPELEITQITRRDTIIEIEIEYARGWSLRGATRLANGASVRFERDQD
jgi:hypothetical protein